MCWSKACMYEQPCMYAEGAVKLYNFKIKLEEEWNWN